MVNEYEFGLAFFLCYEQHQSTEGVDPQSLPQFPASRWEPETDQFHFILAKWI